MHGLRINALTFIVVALGYVSQPQTLISAQVMSELIPQAQFSRTNTFSSAISQTEADSYLRSFIAFDRGSRVLANYKEPGLTRGAKGVSIFRDIAPSVVLVATGDDKQIEGIGTGVVVDASGYVLTNWHVISGHQDAIVFLKPHAGAEVKKEYAYYAQVVYVNPTPDLALLKLVKSPSLPAVALGEVSQAQIAEDLHIIGHPHGQMWSYSTGVLSQIRPDYTWKYEDGSEHRAKVLQMQTAINPGNSGGPVVDDSGKLIGLVAMFEEGQNLDYAISSEVIKAFLGQALSRQTRGVKHNLDQADSSAVTSAAAVGGDRTIYKAEYPEVTVYWMISGKNNQPSCLLIRDKKGNSVEAQRGDSTEGFSDWTATLMDGHRVHASSKSKVPELFWAETTLPSK
jgi:S1-C subfamily serine protease